MNITLRTSETSGTPETPNRFGRLGGWCYDHRRRVLLVWIVAVLAIVATSIAVGSNYRNDFGGTGDSQKALTVMAQRFPARAGDTIQVVYRTASPLTDPANRQRIDRLDRAIAPLSDVTGVTSPFTPSAHGVAADGHIGFSTVQLDRPTSHLSVGAVKAIMHTAQSFRAPRFAVALGGSPISSVVNASPGSSEGVGMTAAMTIMLIAFGSVVAMGLPLLTALFGLAGGYGLLTLFSQLIVDPTFAPEMMAMIGMGVGIDYALLIVTRYRQGLTEGRSPREAVVVAHMTAGRSVLFAGGTVVVSLLGLLVIGQAFMIGLAAGTMIGVFLVMAAALTLLPALLGFAGRNVDRIRLPIQHRTRDRSFWSSWSHMVQRRPVICGLAALGALVVLAIPLLSMRMAFSDSSNDPPSLTTRQAYDTLAKGFGPGFNGPLVLAAQLPPSAATGLQPRSRPIGPATATATLQQLDTVLGRTPGVAAALPPFTDSSGRAASIIVYPTTGPQSAATANLVQRLRGTVIPGAVAGTGVRVYVGGQTAASVDSAAFMSGRFLWVIALVVIVAFCFLMTLFRSLAVAFKAAVMNLLSVAAAFGVIVAVFQWGWLASLFGTRAGPIDPWIPVMIFTITFGLSMDYEVFILSRIREEWLRDNDNSRAVAAGLSATARVITAAAAIMVCVFGSFLINDPLRILNVFPLGLAVAVLVDATLVRMVLVPSVMQLLGRANWWLPARLERRLPHLGVEPDVSA